MADFNVSLASPQGAGATPLQPVQEQTVGYSPDPLLKEVVNIFSKGLENTRKQDALDRKNAIVGEYIKNEQVYSEALTTGQWNSSQTGMASRANFTKMLASYPEYITEITEARRSIYEGTAVGEAQKQVDMQLKERNENKARAAAKGFVFYDGMSQEAEDKLITAAAQETRQDRDTEAAYKRAAEVRANAAEGRAGQSHLITMQNYVDKDNAVKGLVAVADANFDALGVVGRDLMNNPSIPFEQKQLIYGDNIRRIKTGLLSISASNPELAAPWQKLVDEMEGTFTKLADPKGKSEQELNLLKNEYDSQMYKAKLLVTADPKVRNAVAISSLFGNNPTLLDLATSPVLVTTLAQFGLGPDSGGTKPQVVGTTDEKSALKTIKGALSSLQKGNLVGDNAKNKVEAVNTVNEVLRQNATLQGPVTPAMLKDLSGFYSSPEFGKMAVEGQLDKETIQNVKRIFQVNYEPAVIDAVQSRLMQTITRSPGRDMGNVKNAQSNKIYETMNIVFTGSGVAFQNKANARDTWASSSTKDSLKEAEAGLNTLIRMGAHMEGTTDYAKYWETNKHLLLPAIYPDPNKLKPGQVVDGYKYIGGAYGDRSNWQKAN